MFQCSKTETGILEMYAWLRLYFYVIKTSSVVLQKTKIYLVSHSGFGPLSCLYHIFCKLLL